MNQITDKKYNRLEQFILLVILPLSIITILIIILV